MNEGITAFEKKKVLIERLRSFDSLLVAFSGGTDSSFLLAAAQEALGDRVMAVTACSPVHPRRELDEALAFLDERGIPYTLLESGEMRLPEFLANGPDRCYWCKRDLFRKILSLAREKGISKVAHGANLDDMEDYRPGNRATMELGILAPLLEARLGKEEIRFLSREMGLSTWDRPAGACLATRIPYGRPITMDDLRMVEEAEEFLAGKGFRQFRVRHHGAVARIELEEKDIPEMLSGSLRQETARRLLEIGFLHVALDLGGYRQGALNRALDGKKD
ncbi:MAG: ATP-dependent sacrificial sulfur transferase LarE [Deltaproteobacteria bacterium]|nr:ATP-dependent sacrificial sulfur transferase LarE [Deltaproteobacteria bacterium]MBW2016627.1 ATP-dependent sacrificial sulfur transferase LarE [Deltaproteobacteria bacterium]MBW2130113.1 ATP-dependent sacrificial sulfur transferase LarE [Deltaproteobacteria bacterium]MBW2303735.1 ATP-dependent sacrificial sulfur transferase LarE [Deltaproteobacteria bacterium]